MKSDVKIWRHNQSIYNPEYWILEEEKEDCEGLVFPVNLPGVSSIDKLVVQEILLPKHGDILLSSDADIKFDLNSTDKMNCKYLFQELMMIGWFEKSMHNEFIYIYMLFHIFLPVLICVNSFFFPISPRLWLKLFSN